MVHVLARSQQGVKKCKVEFATTNVPYFFDAWKGDQRPVTEYNLGNHSTTIALTLAAHQSIIVGFLRAEDRLKRPLYVKSGPSPSLEYVHDESDNLIAKVPFSSSDLVIENSNGKKFYVSSKGVAKPFALCDWILVAEKWGPPATSTTLRLLPRNSTPPTSFRLFSPGLSFLAYKTLLA
ncbi:hypothetical protein ACHAQE_002076 [Botrytis cinerea]